MRRWLDRSRQAALVVAALLLASCGRGEDVERQIGQGLLLGSTQDGVERYLAIPYAQPPVGALRWREPQVPAPNWQGPRDARNFASACVQGAKPSIARGSNEDCLYLNVWAPAAAKALPVMLWIHGGGQMLGSANEPTYDGAALAREQQVVVVSINFRLSYLGFLATGRDGERAPLLGNQGFLDQLEALRWVHANIADFGGDPQRVTVFGESGGGVATCLLLASPQSAGLIQRAIMQSGSCGIQQVMTPVQAQAQAQSFFSRIGCADAEQPLACARAMSVAQIEARGYQPQSLLAMDTKALSYYPLAVVDGGFLPADPMALLRSRRQDAIPILIGTTKDEGSLFTGLLDFPADEQRYRQHLDTVMPGQGDALADLYAWRDHQPIGLAYSAMFADAMEHCRARRVAALWAEAQPVYQYLFTEAPSAPLLSLMSLRHHRGAAPIGVFHGAEIPYVFGVNGVAGHIWRSRQRETRRLTMRYWANFARNGDPNGPGLPTWPRYQPEQADYLELATPATTGRALRARTCAFWDQHRDFSYW